jgi:hypothetical protein
MKLTREQAAIIGAFTGFLCGPFEDVQAYADEKLQRPTWTHEFGDEDFAKDLKDVSRNDFLAICADK